MESIDILDMMEVGDNLQSAVLDGEVGTVKKLLESGTHNLNSRDKQGRTLLHYTACRGHCEITEILLEHGANPNLKDKNGNTPLHWTGHADVVNLLVTHGAKIDDRNCIEATPKEMAKRRGVPKETIRTFEEHEKDNKNLPKNEKGEFKTLLHEFGDEMGAKNILLLVLVLLFISLYIAYTLTGMNYHLSRSQSVLL